MASYGWMINLTGETIPIYDDLSIPSSKVQIGKITKNECFVDGYRSANPFEGEGRAVFFLNTSHAMTFGVIDDYRGVYEPQFVDFSDYASNGTSWVAVNTLERTVQYDTIAYYADGSKCCDLPTGSKVWLTQNGTAGMQNPNYIAVTDVETNTGKRYNFSGNGFVDLTYGNRWVNVGSILLRKA